MIGINPEGTSVFSSANYWEQRYTEGRNSGAGSYGQLAEFKADVLNEFVAKHTINSVMEFGHGDGNQLMLAKYPKYLGFDVSETIVNICKNKFQNDKSKEFRLLNSYNGEKAELVLSLDVIYHLVEDTIFENYMKTLFEASRKYVIVYASNKTGDQWTKHVKHRKFTDWVEENAKNFSLLKFIPNKYPATDNGDDPTTSFSDFYIFENVKVSVLVPVYNAEKYLRECLNSIVNQTIKEIEIICINDGSVDNSLTILQEYAEKDNRIIVLDNKESKGAAAARNQILEIARGEYIGFVDSDDFIDLNFYEVLYTAAKNQNADLARTTYNNYYTGNLKIPHGLNLLLESKVHAGQNLNINDHSVVIWNAIYRKDFLQKHNISFEVSHKYSNDIIFTIKATYYSSKSIPVLGTFYNWRFFIDEMTQHLSRGGKSNIENFIRVQFCSIDFLNSVEFNDNNDYITAYKRFLWRFDHRFGEMAEVLSVKELKKLFDAFVLAFKSFKYKNELKNEPYFRYLSDKKFKNYLFKKQNPELIVSLSSYPARINVVDKAIITLLNQTKKADKVILWLAAVQFPNKEKDLPPELVHLTNRGLTIEWVNDDIKSYKKLIPALEKYPDSVIVTVDDDNLYQNDLLDKLYSAYLKNPKAIHCGRAYKVLLRNKLPLPYLEWIRPHENMNSIPSYKNFLTGLGGVLYPPGSLHKDILKREIFEKLAPLADDIWFWVMAINKKTKINLVHELNFNNNLIMGTQDDNALWKTNINQGKNDEQLAAVLKKYPVALKRIIKEDKILRIFGIPIQKMSIREFLGRVKRKTIRIILGKQLYQNIEQLQLTNETVIQIKNSIDSNMEKIVSMLSNMDYKIDNKTNELTQTIFDNMENQKRIIEDYKQEINEKFGNINKKIGENNVKIYDNINQKKKAINNRIDDNYKQLRYQIHKYAPESKYPEILTDWYQEMTKKRINLNNPCTFNEKIQWLKLYDSTPIKTQLTDKYLVRNWISEKIGEDYLIPLIGVYDKFEDINFDNLPNQFALKVNHGSAWNIIVNNKNDIDFNKIKNDINLWMNTNFAFRVGYELHYKNIEPKIIIEKYLEDVNRQLTDYKIYYFNGKPEYILIITDRFSEEKMSIFDMNWNLTPIRIISGTKDVENFKKPEEAENLLKLANMLGNELKDIVHFRLDFYIVGGKIYFGEITFTSGSGLYKFDPPEYNKIWGDMIKLPEIKN